MKKYKIAFWVTTTLIFLFEGVLPAFTFQSEMSRAGISHLGYPDYFGSLLTIFKVLGALSLMLPFIPKRVKEWAYAGFGFDFLFAFLSLWAVDGLTGITFFPLIVLVVLAISYVSYHKVQAAKVGGEVVA